MAPAGELATTVGGDGQNVISTPNYSLAQP